MERGNVHTLLHLKYPHCAEDWRKKERRSIEREDEGRRWKKE